MNRDRDSQLYLAGFKKFDDTMWEMIQVRVEPEKKEKITAWCRAHRITRSAMLRLVINRILYNCQTYPGYCTDPLKEINAAVDDVVESITTTVVKKYGPGNGKIRQEKF